MYKGFIRTKNKQAIDKFKDCDIRSFEEVKDLDEYAGILDTNTILVDIDDEVQSQQILKIIKDNNLQCQVLKSRKGVHCLFKNTQVKKCYTKINLGCGIIADIKSGFKNSYEVLKIDGKEREILYDTKDYQELPKYFYPVKTKTVFANLGDGDGRNQELFNYELALQSAQFTVDESKEAIRLINKYVLKEPLSEDELEVILRDEAFLKPTFFDDNNKFLFDNFARFLINTNHIKRINGVLHLYQDGIYVAGNRIIEHSMLEHIPQLSAQRRKEVLSYIDVSIINESDYSNSNLIAFNNGVYDIDKCELGGFSPDHIITNKIPWDYNEAAYNKSTDDVLNNITCNNSQIRELLEEMIGYSLYRRNELGKAFILTGVGRNGKSTFLNMIKQMLGKQNTSVLDMKNLGERFSTAMLLNKLANIGDDISDEFLADASLFKKITTGESISAEFKGQNVFDFSPYCKLMFSANSIPRIGKGRDSTAILRRLIIIPFVAKFEEDDPSFSPYIGDQLKTKEAMEYLIQIGLDGLVRVLDNKKFTNCEAVNKELSTFEVTNNPILGFFNDLDITDVNNHITKDVYKNYQKYCYENGLTNISNGEFSKQAKKYFNCEIIDKSINGKRERIFKCIV